MHPVCMTGLRSLACFLKVVCLCCADLRRPVEVVHQQGDFHHKSWGLVHDWDWTAGRCTVQQVPLCVASF